MKLSPQMKMIAKQFLPPFVAMPLFNSQGVAHPIATLIHKVQTKGDGEILISLCIEHVKHFGGKEAQRVVLEALNNIKGVDDDTKAALICLAKLIMREEKE